MYTREKSLGSKGIADKQYEELIFKYLGETAQSVCFLGNMGCEKEEIIRITTVGVVNPSGRTETFGLSALDFNSISIPTVGNVPIIKNTYNGYKTHTQFGLKRRIISLLIDKNKNVLMGNNGWEYCECFFPENIGPQWQQLMEKHYTQKEG